MTRWLRLAHPSAERKHFRETGVEIIAGGPDETWVMVGDADGNEVVFER